MANRGDALAPKQYIHKVLNKILHMRIEYRPEDINVIQIHNLLITNPSLGLSRSKLITLALFLHDPRIPCIDL